MELIPILPKSADNAQTCKVVVEEHRGFLPKHRTICAQRTAAMSAQPTFNNPNGKLRSHDGGYFARISLEPLRESVNKVIGVMFEYMGFMQKMAKKYQKVTQPWELLLESNDFRHDLSILFDGAFLRSVAQIAGRSNHTKELSAGIELGVRAYLKAQQEMKQRKPGKMETRLIEPIADAAYKLQKAIERVEKTKNPQFKLAASLEASVGIGTGRGADLLAIGTEQFGSGEQFRTLRAITSLLANASAEAVGKNAGDPSEDKHVRGRVILDAEVKAWKGRPQRAPTYPVECFIKAFRPTWQKCSDHPYTEGMYVQNTKQTKSPAVDSIHLIGLRLDSKMPRSRVVTAFRNQIPA